MVQVGIQVVHTDGIDTKNLHQGSISHADVTVAEGVLALVRLVAGRATGLVGDTDDLETVAGRGVDEVVAFDFHGLHGGGQSCAERDQGGLELREDLVSMGDGSASVNRGETHKHLCEKARAD